MRVDFSGGTPSVPVVRGETQLRDENSTYHPQAILLFGSFPPPPDRPAIGAVYRGVGSTVCNTKVLNSIKRAYLIDIIDIINIIRASLLTIINKNIANIINIIAIIVILAYLPF